MLKINLSDDKDDERSGAAEEETIIQPSEYSESIAEDEETTGAEVTLAEDAEEEVEIIVDEEPQEEIGEPQEELEEPQEEIGEPQEEIEEPQEELEEPQEEIEEPQEKIEEPQEELEEPPAELVEESTEESPPDATRRFTSKKVMLTLLIVVIAIGGYLQRDLILSPFQKEPEVVQPPPPLPPPEPEVVPEEPDPTFVMLDKISEAVPPKVWLTKFVINFNGSFDIQGMSFTYTGMEAIVGSLGSIGTLSPAALPKSTGSAEAVYQFTLSGMLGDVTQPEILDVIPGDEMARLAEPVASRSEQLGVKFSRLPKADTIYSDQDLPFVLTGSFDGLKNVIADLCPRDGDIRVFQIVIVPASVGRPYDRVKASFSLRTKSSI